MAFSVNRVTLLGNIGKDPDIKYTQTGKVVAKFSLATSESYNNEAGQRVDKTAWHRITAFNRQAELVREYLRKGSRVYIEGKINYNTWEKNGQKHTSSEILMFNMVMLDDGSHQQDSGQGGQGNNYSGGSSNSRSSSGFEPEQLSDDDIPF